MKLLPYRKLELYSPMPAATVAQVLGDSVEPTNWFRVGGGMRPFEGAVTPPTFEIRRVISYRNSFLPKIRGTITPDGAGSRISITMRLPLAVAIFMTVWLGGACFGAFASATVGVSDPVALLPALIPIGMLLFGSVLTLGAFSVEARKAESLLTFLLDGIQRADATAPR